ncbi:TrbG/VirB9 family P-type conjugative transfer protein, partial [Ochrobactrum sp. GRS2]|nr:TrbG/VirB9 family P-type conjugative transfer protein [Ochrobactrum sp. GRS2]
LGDTESWQVTPNERKNILFVKPVANNVPTNMNIVTNKRMYFIELVDNKPSAGSKVFGVRFIYPENAVNNAMRKEAEYRAANPNISKINKE